jgi:two-component sensor histidine kinase
MDEVTHRMKNNMQMLQSLLGAATREASIPEAREILADVSRRVAAMSAAQDSLYSANATSFEARALLEVLVRNASQGFGRQANIHIEGASGVLSNDAAIPLALIVNELIINAVKHAREERGHVSIRIKLVPVDQEFVLEIADDGPGFTMGEPQKRASGLGLVILLARQLGGTLNVKTDRGACCVVRFGGPRSGR